ncbi:hypothetical protein DS909_14450 [Phaeobacter gallaeciensis]|uniref:Uncharacterized protein n=1 Tax=Phaeobacter gallaeciensis TaxID=60890 RepID=A0A366WSX5_9RHOB|nr:hypothetical protein DS909_14450 [Phaeobacter gallaeciensis]
MTMAWFMLMQVNRNAQGKLGKFLCFGILNCIILIGTDETDRSCRFIDRRIPLDIVAHRFPGVQ